MNSHGKGAGVCLLTLLSLVSFMHCSSSKEVSVTTLHKIHPVEANLLWLSNKVGLLPKQMAKAKTILSNDFAAEDTDRKLYTDIAPQYERALGQRVMKRWEKTASEISNILDNKQNKLFAAVRESQREYPPQVLSLSVRLMLTWEQAEKIGAIMKEAFPHRKMKMDSRPTNSPPEERPAPPTHDKEQNKAQFEKIEKQIEAVLTPGQLVLYKQYNEARKKMFKERRPSGREGGFPGGPGGPEGPGGPGGPGGPPPDGR